MKTNEITLEILKSAVSYDPSTGIFTRAGRSIPNAPIGARADLLCRDKWVPGYRRVKIRGARFLAHRLAWLYVYGELPSGEIDHINGDPGDNSIANLRDVPRGVNAQNRRSCSAHSQTGVLGVHRRKGKFVACISHRGKTLKLGTFSSADEAHAAYLSTKRSLHEGCTI